MPNEFKVGDRVRTTGLQPPAIGIQGAMGTVVKVYPLARDAMFQVLVNFDMIGKDPIAMRSSEIEGIPQ